MKINIVNIGCFKNLVDSERLMKQLCQQGNEVIFGRSDSYFDVVIINTCGFVSNADDDSIAIIKEYALRKRKNLLGNLWIMGCYSQKRGVALMEDVPEVDRVYGNFDWLNIVSDLGMIPHYTYERILTTPKHYAYLKISEGCNRFCAFCAIPLITGRHKSVPIDDLLDEVRTLVAHGVKEFNVIAQDLSSYGLDLYGEMKLPELVDRMAQIPGVEWIRLHYAYPTQFPYELLPVMAKHPNVCKYLDIALQHISDKVLANMRRHIGREETLALLERLRREVPGIHIRTTLMTGFPGEGEAEFEELKQFVRDAKFDRMGAFAYSEEEGTYAQEHYDDVIPQEVKDARLSELMDIQEQISLELNEQKVGTVQRVIIDSEEDDYYVGRTQYDSPEVDPEVLIKKDKKLKTGEFYDVTIVEAMPFDLIGEVR